MATLAQDQKSGYANLSTRVAYGRRLAELGESNPKIVVMDADLSGSTQTGIFAKKYPERFFNVGVAEQDLMGTAAGLAQSGFTVFASTFAMFAAGRAWEIVRQSIVYPHFNVKICPSHSGITVGEDGASHQIIEDIALMRSIPEMTVLVPADGQQTRAMVDFCADFKGPVYLRLGRSASTDVFGDDYVYVHGKGHVLLQGTQVCLFATGFVTSATLEAGRLLTEQGISTTVVNLPSVKPIDSELIVKMAQTHGALFSVEEHNVQAGFGSAIAEVLTTDYPARLTRLGMQDEFGQSGSFQELLAFYKLDAKGIVASVLEALKR